MKAVWRDGLHAAVKDDGGAEKKRKTTASEDEEQRGAEVVNWRHGVIRAFEQEVALDRYEQESDAYFSRFIDVIQSLAHPRSLAFSEIRLHPGLYIRFRRSEQFEADRFGLDAGKLNYNMFFIDEDSDDAGNADVFFYRDREYGSFIRGDDTPDQERIMIEGYDRYSAADLIDFIRATRLGITEIGVCCTLVESDSEEIVTGPFNMVWQRREELAELDVETEDLDEVSAPPFLVVESKQ